jgi:hypothetical protein
MEAKEFIRKCLAYRQEARWDVLTASQDPYLCLTKSAAAAAGALGSAQAAPGGIQQQQSLGITNAVGTVAASGTTNNHKRAAASGFGSLLKTAGSDHLQ